MSTKRFFIYRGDVNGGEEKAYDVPIEDGMVVLDAVHWIGATIDNDLAVRWNCKAAKCGSCSAEINGMPKLMCKTRVSDYPGKDIHVRPLKTFPVIKDLVTDVSRNYEVAKKIPPFAPPEEEHVDFWKMDQVEVRRVQEFRKCIECFLCQDTCHVLRDHNRKDVFYGPRFMTRLAALEMHPMDRENRIEFIKEQAGVDYCNVTAACTDVCPENIAITDNANIPLKERITDVYYDPLMRLVHFLFPSKRDSARKRNGREPSRSPELVLHEAAVQVPKRPSDGNAESGREPTPQESPVASADKSERNSEDERAD